jgi:hypothetical protein
MSDIKVFSPDVSQFTNTTITKTDILNMFENDFREDLERRRKEILEKAKVQREKTEELSRQGHAVLEKESDRIIARFRQSLEGIVIFPKELKIKVEFVPNPRKKFMTALFAFKTNDDPPFMMGSRIGPYMVGFMGYGYSDSSPPPNLEAVVDRKVYEEYGKIMARVRDEEKILAEFNKEARILENEIYNLPSYVKKFSTELTRESLLSLPTGKALLENIKEMTATAMKRFEQEFQQKLLGGYQLL